MTPVTHIEDITILGEDRDIILIPEDIFFEERERGILRPNTLPQPKGVKHWMRALYLGEPIHFARVGDTIWIIADTKVFGYCMFKQVCTAEDDTTFKVANIGGNRIITKERSNVFMQTLTDLASRYANPNQNVPQMNLGGNAPQMTPVPGEGVSPMMQPRRLHSEILTRGFIAGYVMANAPQISLTVNRKRAKDGTVTANIVAKESKPSRCLSVMMALPAAYVQRNGALATPADIQAGMVDFSSDKTEMMYLPMTVNTAISYISAIGGKIPEYAPTVSDAREQWSPADILSGKPEVSFVWVKPTENRRRNSRSSDQFRFNLKTTSSRRSLYTPQNIVCLRALEHTSVKCNTEKEAYRLNEIAFGAMRYRKKKDETENALQRAMADCPSQIWHKVYEIDGEKKDGIGSAFFMAGSSVKSESGEEISLRKLHYIPWDATGDNRTQMGAKVESIVLREFRAAEGGKKENMVTCPILYRESPNDPVFRGYARFVDYLVNTGFITRDQLSSMGTRASKSRTRSLELTPEQQSSLEYFMRSESVQAEIQMAISESADRAVLREAVS